MGEKKCDIMIHHLITNMTIDQLTQLEALGTLLSAYARHARLDDSGTKVFEEQIREILDEIDQIII